MLIVALLVWLLWYAKSISDVTQTNLRNTHCNQAILLFNATGYYDAPQISFCPANVKKAMEVKKPS